MTPAKLRNLMSEYQLNAKKVAGILHVSVSSVYHWRSGIRTMPEMAWDLLVLKAKKPASMTLAIDEWSVG
jgi:DNA-binding transcriptional regulator YiaG